MTIDGSMVIGRELVVGTGPQIYARNPATGEVRGPGYGTATAADVARACSLAAAAFPEYRRLPLDARAAFLSRAADEIDALGDELISLVVAETAIPHDRVVAERTRTTNQLRFFAKIVLRGEWLDARVDHGIPDRVPLPRPDIRSRYIPVGPVAVFGSSNFPLAFSVAGGDSASALAAGCPVIVKGHSSHPGTCELVARAFRAAAIATDMPEGVFSLLLGAGSVVGIGLVTDPAIASVGFTGSRAGGLALLSAAAGRPKPIPVFAEMSSINPVFVLPAALDERAEAIGRDFVASLQISQGQLCTNPGLVIAVDGPGVARLASAVEQELAAAEAGPMLNEGIGAAYHVGVESLRDRPGVVLLAEGNARTGTPNTWPAVVFRTSAREFMADPTLSAEIFGAASVLVVCEDASEMAEVAQHLEGQLTASIHFSEADSDLVRQLIPELETLAGRITFNGWPTGVEVVDSMVHGGPFPATTDSRFTSVGGLAIRRFLRPVAFQGAPPWLLPPELADTNPLGIRVLIDGAQEGHV